MVRLSQGPAWGALLQGSPIEPRRVAAAPDPEQAPKAPPIEPEQPEPPPDPRSEPLPYAAFRKELLAATSARKFDRALELVAAAQGNPELSDAAQFLEWDREDVQQLQQFWSEFEETLGQMKPGEELRFGAIEVEFESYAEGVITAKARTKSVDKPVSELDAAAVVSIAERAIDKDEQAEALRPAVFLTYSGDGSSSRRQSWLQAAGEAGAKFRSRLAEREAELARKEIARENIAAGLARLKALEERHAGTPAADAAETIRTALYERTQWREAGGRQWKRGPEGEYTAGPERAEGALLVSPREHENFHLSLEYRTNERAGQGGVYFKHPGSGRSDRALKIQLSSDAGVRPDLYSTGSLFGLDAPKSNAAPPVGKWARLEVTVVGDRVRVAIDGKEVLSTTFPTSDRPQAGHVALDGVSGGISYRKIILSDRPPAN
jgi:hypothetical protein